LGDDRAYVGLGQTRCLRAQQRHTQTAGKDADQGDQGEAEAVHASSIDTRQKAIT